MQELGNAKSNRNDNSSRFGKCMNINFDFIGDPVGEDVKNYLYRKIKSCSSTKSRKKFSLFLSIT